VFCRIIPYNSTNSSEIAARKKIITDEHSGRILVDAALADEERENGTTFKIVSLKPR
jgi:hypothetical protein